MNELVRYYSYPRRSLGSMEGSIIARSKIQMTKILVLLMMVSVLIVGSCVFLCLHLALALTVCYLVSHTFVTSC